MIWKFTGNKNLKPTKFQHPDHPIDQPTSAKTAQVDQISLCESCYCATKTIDGKCGKCGAVKKNLTADPTTTNWKDKFRKLYFDWKKSPDMCEQIINLIRTAIQDAEQKAIKDTLKGKFYEKVMICSEYEIPADITKIIEDKAVTEWEENHPRRCGEAFNKGVLKERERIEGIVKFIAPSFATVDPESFNDCRDSILFEIKGEK